MNPELIALTDRGARYSFLGEAFRRRQLIPNEQIVDMDFSRIEINDDDVEVLAPLTNLQGISFWNTGITDRAIEIISGLEHLVRLNLCGTQVTDASVPTLIALRLDYIDVAETNLTAEGIEKLRAGLPHAEILV